jgi:hypothetical protein
MIPQREDPGSNERVESRNETTPLPRDLTTEQVDFARVVGRLLAIQWEEETLPTSVTDRLLPGFPSTK